MCGVIVCELVVVRNYFYDGWCEVSGVLCFGIWIYGGVF